MEPLPAILREVLSVVPSFAKAEVKFSEGQKAIPSVGRCQGQKHELLICQESGCRLHASKEKNLA